MNGVIKAFLHNLSSLNQMRLDFNWRSTVFLKVSSFLMGRNKQPFKVRINQEMFQFPLWAEHVRYLHFLSRCASDCSVSFVHYALGSMSCPPPPQGTSLKVNWDPHLEGVQRWLVCSSFEFVGVSLWLPEENRTKQNVNTASESEIYWLWDTDLKIEMDPEIKKPCQVSNNEVFVFSLSIPELFLLSDTVLHFSCLSTCSEGTTTVNINSSQLSLWLHVHPELEVASRVMCIYDNNIVGFFPTVPHEAF